MFCAQEALDTEVPRRTACQHGALSGPRGAPSWDPAGPSAFGEGTGFEELGPLNEPFAT